MDELRDTISELHHRLEAMETQVTSEPAIVTGVQGVRIMRLVALISGNAFRYVLVRKRQKGRWC
jgi:hypothetical protein